MQVRKGEPINGKLDLLSCPQRSKGQQGAGSAWQGYLLSSASVNTTSGSSLLFPPLFRKMNLWGRGVPSAFRADSQQRRGKNGSQGLGWGSLGAWSPQLRSGGPTGPLAAGRRRPPPASFGFSVSACRLAAAPTRSLLQSWGLVEKGQTD